MHGARSGPADVTLSLEAFLSWTIPKLQAGTRISDKHVLDDVLKAALTVTIGE